MDDSSITDEDRAVYAREDLDIEDLTVEGHAIDEIADEELAKTQEALAEEREEIEAAISAGEIKGTPPVGDDHQDEFEELGLALAWWREEKGEAPLSILFGLAEDVEGYFNHINALVRCGLPKDGVTAREVSLDLRTGPLVFAALQTLGVLVPSLRDEIRNVIKIVSDSIPDPTEEEKAVMVAAHERLANEQQDEFLKSLAEMGFTALTLEQFAASQVERDEPVEYPTQDFDSGLN